MSPFFRRDSDPAHPGQLVEAEAEPQIADAEVPSAEPRPFSLEALTAAPEIRDMVRLSNRSGILAQMRGVTIDTINQRLASAPMDRRLKRAFINSGLAVRAAGAAQALAQLMAEPGSYPAGDVNQRYQFGQSMLAPYRDRISKLITEDEIYRDIYRAAVNLESDLTKYRAKSESYAQWVGGGLAEDISLRYRFAEFLAGVEFPAGDVQPSPEDEAEQWVVKLLRNPYDKGVNVIDFVAREALSGAYDQFLAEELLSAVSRKPAIQNLLTLAGADGQTEAGQEIIERLARSLPAWPKEAQAILSERRGELLARISAASEGSKNDLAGKFGLQSDGFSSEERFARSMEKMIEAVWSVSRSALGHAPHEVKKRLLTPARPALSSTVAARPLALPEAVKEVDNRLVYVDKNGLQYDMDSPEYKKLLDEALSRYKGTKDFPSDIQAALDYISHIDFTKPTGRVGLEKIKAGNWQLQTPDGLVEKPLYRFKSQTAVGLPVKTQVMKDHRLMLALIDSNTVGLVGIVPRRDLNDFLKSVGLNTGAR